MGRSIWNRTFFFFSIIKKCEYLEIPPDLRTLNQIWCTDGNWGIFFSSNFHTPPVTTPVTNLGHVHIPKITGSCMYYRIVNT
jgi:hypothetical protein